MTFAQQVSGSAFIVLSLAVIGGIFENKRWAHFLEIHRQFICAFYLLVTLSGAWTLIALVPVLMAVFYYSKTLGANSGAPQTAAA